MIYITGDCHGNFERFNASIFPEQNEMTKDDYVIICGDFGGVWNKDEESKMETMILDWLDCKPFTTLFVSGNQWTVMLDFSSEIRMGCQRLHYIGSIDLRMR